MAGPSGKGVAIAGATATLDEARLAAESPPTTVRLGGVTTAPLPAEWIAYLQLPAEPGWMQFFAPKRSANGKPWHADLALSGKFHPEMPDDIEATFVLLKEKTLEKMWVRIEGVEPDVGYRASLLNTAHASPALAAGMKVLVRPSKSHPPMLWVPPAAAQNLARWSTVCEACGFDLLFIPVDELAKMQFPDAPPGAVVERFTTRCLMCRATMHVAKRA